MAHRQWLSSHHYSHGKSKASPAPMLGRVWSNLIYFYNFLYLEAWDRHPLLGLPTGLSTPKRLLRVGPIEAYLRDQMHAYTHTQCCDWSQ